MKRLLIITYTIFFLGFVAGGVYFLFAKNNERPKNLTKFSVRLGWVHQAQFAGMYVAKEKGYYAEAGLDVDLLEAQPNTEQTDELAEGKVDASVMEAHQLLGDNENIKKLQAVAAIYQTNPHALAVRKDSDIKDPGDFSGRIVGLSGDQSREDNLFRLFVGDENVLQSVSYNQLGFDTVDDFVNKRADIIDVYRTDQPYLAEKKGVPLRLIPLELYGFSTYGDVLAVNKSLSESSPERVHSFVSATLRGWKYALDYPEEAVAIVMKYAKGNYADREYEEHILYESMPLVRGNAADLGIMDIVPWSNLYEAMRRSGVIVDKYELKEIYTNKFVY